MYGRNAGQLWRITCDRRVQSKLVDQPDGELGEDCDRSFDGNWMFPGHVRPAKTTVSL